MLIVSSNAAGMAGEVTALKSCIFFYEYYKSIKLKGAGVLKLVVWPPGTIPLQFLTGIRPTDTTTEIK
jgi:hypothetical protein